jgi:hypothetical protein
MEKKVISFAETENVMIRFQKQDIEVVPLIPLDLQAFLIENYVANYFYPQNRIIGSLKKDYLGAELNLRLLILDRLTSVSITGEDENYTKNLCSELWDLVEVSISNYWSFRESLDKVVEEVEKEIAIEKSVGGVLDKLSEKISYFMDKLNSIPIEDMKKITKDASKLLKQVETSQAASLFVEAGKAESEKVQ